MNLGPIPIPDVNDAGVFPLGLGINPETDEPLFPVDFGSGMAMEPGFHVHRFEGTQFKREQRFYEGAGALRFTIKKSILKKHEVAVLASFFEDCKGIESNFLYYAAQQDGTAVAYRCRFAEPVLSFSHLTRMLATVGLDLIEDLTVASEGPYESVAETTRIPSEALQDALLEAAQALIPLLKITTRGAAPVTIYISDRTVEIDGHVYANRLADWDGISQSIEGGADNAVFTLGNADDIVTKLINTVDLFRASVEFSLFHVQSLIKVDLWAGYLSDNPGWSIDKDTVRITASDGIYSLASAFPTRRITRTCWKTQGDGVWCHGDPGAPCGKVYKLKNTLPTATINGCNSVEEFGGITVDPQSGGKTEGQFHFSILNDSIYDKAVREIYTDIPMPVSCDVVAVRDENEFLNGLCIVGEGPLTKFDPDVRTHTLNGSSPNVGLPGEPPVGGFRPSLGNDPAVNRFGLHNSPWHEDDASVNNFTWAAGTAWAGLQIKDANGIQLLQIGQQTMSMTIDGGLGGWVWTAPGARTWVAPLTNPIWIAINAHLKALGIKIDPTHEGDVTVEQMEEFFRVDLAVAAAAECDRIVPSLINSGHWERPTAGSVYNWVADGATEKQWTFRGVIQEEKPWRDWMTDILNTCLGYFYFDFNRLCVGLRRDSSVVEAFTEDNVLLDSVVLSQYAPSFNELTVDFMDPEFGWGQNNCNIYDEDAQYRIGSLGQRKQLKQNISLSGCSSKSQAARFAPTRLREELGGVTVLEQLRARRVSFQTTVLALNVQPGMICGLSHRRCPDGVSTAYDEAGVGTTTPMPHYIEFRTLGWKLNKDYTITITGKTTTDSMYDLEKGPKASDAGLPEVPVTNDHRLLVVPAWEPGTNIPVENDALFDLYDRTFVARQEYEIQRDGTQRATIAIVGKQPVTKFASSSYPKFEEVDVISGGELPGATYFFVSILAHAIGFGYSWPSKIASVKTPPGDGYAIRVMGIKWPEDTDAFAWGSGKLFINQDSRLMGIQVAPLALDENIEFDGNAIGEPVARSFAGLPIVGRAKIRIKAKLITHSGIIGFPVFEVNEGASQVTLPWLIQPSTSFDYAGRYISLLSRSDDLTSPEVDFIIGDDYDPATGICTLLGADGLPADVSMVHPGDVMVLRFKSTTIGDDSIGDELIENHFYPAGETVDRKGDQIRIIRGKGRGQRRTIKSNTTTVYTIDQPWADQPDETSIWVVEGPAWAWSADTDWITNSDPDQEITCRLPLTNLWNQTIIIGGFLVYPDGRETNEEVIPLKEVWIFGQPRKSRTITADSYLMGDDDLILIDTSAGDVSFSLLSPDDMLGRHITIFKITDDANVAHILDQDGDEIGTLTVEGDSMEIRSGEIG